MRSLGVAHEEALGPEPGPRAPRLLRMSLALGLLAALLAQSVIAIAAPSEARAGHQPPAYLPAPQRSQTPSRSPGSLPSPDPDHRHC